MRIAKILNIKKTKENSKILFLGQFFPFCINSCKDVQHNCSNCHAYIGTYDRMKQQRFDIFKMNFQNNNKNLFIFSFTIFI